MRRISLLIALFAAVALGAAPGAEASCSAAVRWNGTTYAGTPLRTALPLGAPLPGGVVPACDDVILVGPDGQRMNPEPQDQPVELRPIVGVPAALAVARRGYERFAYLAPGTLPQLRTHPLHRALFGNGQRSAERRRGCLARRTVAGTVEGFQPGLGPLLVTTPGGRTAGVAVEATTDVAGAKRIGRHPVLRPGERVTVTGPRCGSGGQSVLVAERIRVGGRRAGAAPPAPADRPERPRGRSRAA